MPCPPEDDLPEPPICQEYSYPPTRQRLYSPGRSPSPPVMDFLKLLPILFVAAQGEARAIHQQLLPAIPGYVPVYIQQGPDVEVIYEAGRKVAVHDSEKAGKPVEGTVPQKLAEEEAQEEQSSQDEAKEVLGPAQDEPRPLEPAKVAQDDKSTHEDQGGSSAQKVGTGSAVLVPGYQPEPASAS